MVTYVYYVFEKASPKTDIVSAAIVLGISTRMLRLNRYIDLV